VGGFVFFGDVEEVFVGVRRAYQLDADGHAVIGRMHGENDCRMAAGIHPTGEDSMSARANGLAID
jgi:hypothetical protein